MSLSSHSRAQPLAAYALIAAALWMRWPVLYTGFTVDDYAQLAMIEGHYPVPRAPLSLFTFSDGSLQENTRLREVGFFPWWSDPELRVSLMRPLASLLMWFDSRTFGHDAFAYHLHSAAWWIAMCVVLWQFLRRVTPGWASVVAFALILFHPTHTVALGWIANRNALVSTTFVLLGLIAQLRAQRERPRGGWLTAAGCYAVGVLASEYALPTLAYAVVLSLLGPHAPPRPVHTLGRWALAGITYAGLRASLGYGTRNSGMYIDPLREPVSFLIAASQRLPVLMGDAVLAIRSSWWSVGFPWARDWADAGIIPQLWAADLRAFRTLQVAAGLIACVVYFVVAWRAFRGSPEPSRELRFFALGVPLTFVPCAASLPESRLMLPALIGWCPLLAHAFVQRSNGFGRAAIGGLIALTAIVPAWTGLPEIRGLPALSNNVRASILSPKLDDVIGDGKHVLLAGAVDPTTTIYIPLVRKLHGRPAPASSQLLIGGWGPLRLTRVSPTALELERLNRGFTPPDEYASAFNRGSLRVGERFRSGMLEAQVLAVHEGRPMRVRFELGQFLVPPLVLIAQTERGLERIDFPALGHSIRVEPAGLPRGD